MPPPPTAPPAVPSAGGGTGPGPRAPWRPRLVAVRHGATEWSRAGRHTGRTDLPLLAEGVRQAEALGPRLAGLDPARVYTSPLLRARQTCEIAGFAGSAVVSEDLREWDYGDYEGRTTDEIHDERPGWTLWRDGAPGGESATDVARRADRVVAAVRALPGDALVFAHAHILRVVAARWIGLGPEAGALLALDPATVSVLGWERVVAVVSRWNEAGGGAPV